MNYASLHASLQPKPVQKNQIVSLTYNNKPVVKPTVTVPQTATAANTPNTVMLRDATSSTNIATLNVHSKLNVTGGGATISGGAVINGTMKITGTIDSSLTQGIVCSSSSGILSTRPITSADILDFSVTSSDIKNGAIITSKLGSNLFLAGAPTCNIANACGESHIANVGYVNRYVTKYVDKFSSLRSSNNGGCACSDSDEDEFNPSIFHATVPNYVVLFNYTTYVIENATTVIEMPRKKKEGYCVKFYNKSGESVFIKSDGNHLMYNATYSPSGTYSQVVENDRCVIFTYVYVGTIRSWSYQYF
jgi:hypothetical protein